MGDIKLLTGAFEVEGGRRCAFCGEPVHGGLYMMVYDMARGPDGFVGYACWPCVGNGPDYARERALETVTRLRQHADHLETVAARLGECSDWPSADEIERLALELELERRAGVTDKPTDEDDIPF